MSDEFFVVGIGASAGGIHAIRQFFEHVPPDSGMAYVVILHLSPDYDSKLAEVLQLSANIPVAQVQSRVRIQPNHVYVIPPHKSLAIDDGHLAVSEMTRFEERRAPVDIFFRTLAATRGPYSACVVLSGTGADGSMGLKRMKEEGGICLVQDPDEAEYGDMPRNSIGTTLVDYVLPVAEIPARIIAYRNGLDAIPLHEQAPDVFHSDEASLRDILLQLRSRTGHDFSNYKRPTVLRRLARRMSLHTAGDMKAYARVLREQPDEVKALLKDLLISVTTFFRDRETFETLERVVIPALFAGKTEADQIRVWVAGCATGEEAYSIGMLLSEHATAAIGGPSVQIFATDIDEAAVVVARQGVYSVNDAADVSPERLRRFFAKDGDGYRVRSELREMILFADHNIVKDPPFSHLDLISCRNLLIYLNREAQHRVLQVMHFALKPRGYLFVGASESVEAANDLFITVDKEAHVFQSRAITSRFAPGELTAFNREVTRRQLLHLTEEEMREDSSAEVHQRLLEQYAPPSVVVNEHYDIVHLSESAGRYLHHTGGPPTHNLLKVIRPELRMELRTALYQASQQRTSIESPDLSLSIGDRTAVVSLMVRPVLNEKDPARGFFLVIFRHVGGEADVPHAPIPATASGDDLARQYEDEVTRVRAQLTATVERHETQAEELKASNEELQAVNEELRSSAEELETSKEELQSLNEELRTVNQELKIKVEEQAQANDDIQNLINSTEIVGTVFLDRATCIKFFTPRARDLFTPIPGDLGRPLSDISSALVGDQVQADVARVIERLERVERHVRTRDDRWFLMRVLPYRTSDDRIDGAVLTFVDVTGRTKIDDRLRSSESRMRLIMDSVQDFAIFTMDGEGLIDSWNTGAARTFGYTEPEILGRSGATLFTPADLERGIFDEGLRRAVSEGQAGDERWHVRKDGTQFYASGVVAPLRDSEGTVLGFVKIARDLTERKHWEDELQQGRDELEARVHQRTRELAALNVAIDAELRERRHGEEQIRGLMRRLITVQEDERRRIARDLHDHLGQLVAGLSLKIESLASLTSQPELQVAIEVLQETIGKLDRDLDFFTWELRPAALDDLGLVVTLRNYVAEWSKGFGIPAEFQSRGLDNPRLASEVETNIYRIAQEALNNIYKHAQATEVGVILDRRGQQAVLLVEDNGAGFNRAERANGQDMGIGLLGMHERAAFIGATLEIETAPGRGTAVFLQVPLPLEAGAPSDSDAS